MIPSLSHVLRNKSSWFFVLVLLSVALFYDYQDILQKRPQGIHQWRQSDCASIALNYYQHGMRFVEPQTHNLTADGGKTGYHATSELPILYYSVASLYHLFGPHEIIYRLLNMLLFLVAIFFLFKAARLYLDVFWSGILALLVLSSPVLVYYGNNFLSNISGFSVSLIGWYFFFKHVKAKHDQSIYWAILLFGLAASLKLPAAMSIVSICGLWLVETTMNKPMDQRSIRLSNSRFIGICLVAVLPALGWAIYAHAYNGWHDTTYFSTTVFPIWQHSMSQIKDVISGTINTWGTDYFSLSMWVFIGISVSMLLVLWRKLTVYLKLILGALILQVFVFILLQFQTFPNHDYYTINLFVLPIMLVFGLLETVQKTWPAWLKSNLIRVAVLVFMVWQIVQTKSALARRYADVVQFEALHTIEDELETAGVSVNDTVIFIPDFAHTSLYLMNRPGFTEYDDARFGREEAVKYNQSAQGIETSIEHGAKYLILQSVGEIFRKPYLKDYCRHLQAEIGGVLVFDLTDTTRNYVASYGSNLVYKATSSLETLSGDSSHYIADTLVQYMDNQAFFKDSIFHVVVSATTDLARSGSQSELVDAKFPYAVSSATPILSAGQSIVASVWTKCTNQESREAMLVIENGNAYYSIKHPIEIVGGWNKLELVVPVDSKLAGKSAKVYGYAVSEDTVVFDDISIAIYSPDL